MRPQALTPVGRNSDASRKKEISYPEPWAQENGCRQRIKDEGEFGSDSAYDGYL
jgi:hypothetical protein